MNYSLVIMLHELSGSSDPPADPLLPAALFPLASRSPHPPGFLPNPLTIPFQFPLLVVPTYLASLNIRKPQSQSLVLFPLCSLFPNIMASSIMCRLLMPSRRPQRSISLLNSRAVYPTTFSTPSLGCLKGISVSPIISS